MRFGLDFSMDGMGVSFFGSGGGTTQTVQKADPWAGQQPYLTGTGQNTWAPTMNGGAASTNGNAGLFGSAQALYQDTSQWPTYYPGSTVAQFNPQETTALGQIYNVGMNGTPAYNAAAGNLASIADPSYTAGTGATFGNANEALNRYASGDMLSAGNPYFQQMASTTLANTMPSITAGFNSGNRLDSGLATRAASMGANDAIGNLAYQNYQQGQQNQLGAAGLASNNLLTQQGNQLRADMVAPAFQQQAMSNAQGAFGAGAQQQQQQQANITEDVNRYNYNAMLPWNMLNQYQNAIQGGYGGTTTLTQPYYQNDAANWLAGGTAALGLGNAAAGAAGYAGLFPMIASFFSDRRLKDDVREIGETKNGLPLYSFRYKWEVPGTLHIGLMAQDVKKDAPEAVHKVDGFYAVDYGKALGLYGEGA